MKKGSFVPKNVPGVGWDGVGGVCHGGGSIMEGWGVSWRDGVGWGVSWRGGMCQGGVGWVI